MNTEIIYLHELIGDQDNPVAGGNEQLGFELKHFCRGKSDGVHVLKLTCGDKTIEILPTRGLGIWRAYNQGIRFGWDSPVQGPIHPMWVPLDAPCGLGWLDGFDEMLVRCGLNSNGAPEFEATGQLKWPLHGQIANLPAQDVIISIDEESQRISVTGVVLESRFHFYRWQLTSTISMRMDSDEIEVLDRITNLSARPGSVQMLYHCNFGPPVLEKGSKFYAPVKKVAPRDAHAAKGIEEWNTFASPDPKYVEEVYFMELATDDENQTPVLLTNADQTLGALVRYFDQHLPCFTLWKNTVGLADGYVAGLEPGTNFPNPRGCEEQHDRVVNISPGQSVEMKLAIGMLIGERSIGSAIDQIKAISPAKPKTERAPLSTWSVD